MRFQLLPIIFWQSGLKSNYIVERDFVIAGAGGGFTSNLRVQRLMTSVEANLMLTDVPEKGLNNHFLRFFSAVQLVRQLIEEYCESVCYEFSQDCGF